MSLAAGPSWGGQYGALKRPGVAGTCSMPCHLLLKGAAVIVPILKVRNQAWQVGYRMQTWESGQGSPALELLLLGLSAAHGPQPVGDSVSPASGSVQLGN